MLVKNFWQNHKRAILIAGGIIVGGTVIVLLRHNSSKNLKLVVDTTVGNTFDWSFDNIEEALQKFKDVEAACIALGSGEVAMFGGASGALSVVYL